MFSKNTNILENSTGVGVRESEYRGTGLSLVRKVKVGVGGGDRVGD